MLIYAFYVLLYTLISPVSHYSPFLCPTCVPSQLAAHAHVALTGLQVVDGADVVQATAGHVVPGRGVGARHHPRGTQRDGVDLENRES